MAACHTRYVSGREDAPGPRGNGASAFAAPPATGGLDRPEPGPHELGCLRRPAALWSKAAIPFRDIGLCRLVPRAVSQRRGHTGNCGATVCPAVITRLLAAARNAVPLISTLFDTPRCRTGASLGGSRRADLAHAAHPGSGAHSPAEHIRLRPAGADDVPAVLDLYRNDRAGRPGLMDRAAPTMDTSASAILDRFDGITWPPSGRTLVGILVLDRGRGTTSPGRLSGHESIAATPAATTALLRYARRLGQRRAELSNCGFRAGSVFLLTSWPQRPLARTVDAAPHRRTGRGGARGWPHCSTRASTCCSRTTLCLDRPASLVLTADQDG